MSNSQNAPEILPELSESATRLKRDKLDRVPYDHSGKHPGKRWAQNALDIMFELGNRAIFRRYDSDSVPPAEGGVIYVATHINGLVDPMVITRVQKKRVISLGAELTGYSSLPSWRAWSLAVLPFERVSGDSFTRIKLASISMITARSIVLKV